MSRGVWEAVETEAGKIGVAKAKRGRSKREGKKETRGKSREKTEKEKDNRGEEDS